MALDVQQLYDDIESAFTTSGYTWSDCAEAFSNAIDTFIRSGLITTTVTGTVVPPFPAPPYSATGVGTYDTSITPEKGSMTTPGLPTLKSILIAKLNDNTVTWAMVGPIIASAIDDYVKVITLTTDVETILEGIGIGSAGCIDTAATYGTLVNQLTQVFTSQAIAQTWETVVSYITNAINSYIIGTTVSTIDSGSSPNPWTGTGVGFFS